MQNALKLALAAAALIAVVIAGMNLISQSEQQVGVPPASSTPSPAPTIASEQAVMQVALSPVRLTLDNPTGWSAVSDDAGAPPFITVRSSTAPQLGMAVYFYAPSTVYNDPCQQTPASPPVGRTVNDLVQALREIPNITATDPVSTTLAGLPATYLEMTYDDALPCAPDEFYIWSGLRAHGPGQIVRTWVLDVDGNRIVVGALRYQNAPEAGLAEQQQVIDSIQFK